MLDKPGNYHVVDLPPSRREMPNILDVYWWKHVMYGMLEVDVTIARQYIAAQKARTGEALSFTGYLVYCLARAVNEDKTVQGYLKGRKQLVLFEDVDVAMSIERQIGATRAPMVHVIQRANHKTFRDIHNEIRAAQTQPVPTSKGMSSTLRFALLLPQPIPMLFSILVRLLTRRDPTILVKRGGTVGVTSVGMFGQRNGWGITNMPQSLYLVIGGIGQKPAIVENRIEPREMLSLTVSFDHDVIDGAPAARLVRRLIELIESGHGLDEDQPIPAVVPATEAGNHSHLSNPHPASEHSDHIS